MSKHASVPEDSVKARLRRLLPNHFLVLEEIVGNGLQGERNRIDFWCYPKAHTIALGWPAAPFGIECKSQELEDHRKRTAIRLVYQAIVYRTMTFPTKDGPRRPAFVLVYPPLSVLLDLGIRERNPVESFMDGVEYALARFAALWNVGELMIDEAHCEVRFHGTRWFHSRHGRNGSCNLAKETTRASR